MLDTVSINALQHREDLGMAALEKTGPNDVICVVWATSELFFLYSIVFLCMLKLDSVSRNALQH